MSKIYGADFSTLISADSWRAIKVGIVHPYQGAGRIASRAAQSLAGEPAWVDVYHFPNRHVDAAQQVNDALDALGTPDVRYNRCWFHVEDSGQWSRDPAINAGFLRRLISAAEARGVPAGIYTSTAAWSKLIADDVSLATTPLWYAHWDRDASQNGIFREYGPTAGWSALAMQPVKGDAHRSDDASRLRGDQGAPCPTPPPGPVLNAVESSASIYGADVSTLVPPDGWRALKTNHSASFGIVRCYQSNGQVDPNAAQSLKNAVAAGLSWVDVYHFPSGNVDPSQQVNDALTALSSAGASFNRYWFDVQDGDLWSSNPTSNAAILRQLIAAAEAKSVRVGIYTSYAVWSKIMANDTSFAAYPLWYAHWDGNASFSDFRTYGPKGGWAAPAMKQFRANECCSYGNHQSVWYDGNYCPGDSAAVPTSTPPPAGTSEPPPASTSEPPPAPDTTDIRTRIVNFARSVVNLDANPNHPLSRAEYISLIAPVETPSAESSMATMSGCGLTVAGIWRACGLYDASLNAPYKVGSAISRLAQIADKYGAWVPYSASTAPSPGDMVLLENTEHVYTVIQINSTTGGYALESVDGGQTDANHYQTILQVSRTWSGYDTNSYSTRPIIGWVDVQKLPFASTPPVVGFVQGAPASQKGFEAERPLDASTIRSLAGQDYRFCVRTIALDEGIGADDLSYAEAQAIVSAGLGLMAIQRTSTGTWVPSANLGQQRGQIAAANAKAAGLPMCVTLWLYLAGVSPTTTAQAVVDYCNSWYTAVYNAGFTPGLCVGESPGLDSSALYKLSFKHYWRAIGKSIPNVQTRGYQMLESTPSTANEFVTGDLTTQNDSQGDCVQWLIATPIVSG